MQISVTSLPRRRTWFTTLLAMVTILVGALGSVFSAFALLMAIGKPYASSFDLKGVFFIFILPPGTLLAGFGLLLRQRWARWWMILLVAGWIGLGVKGLFAPLGDSTDYAPLPGPAREAWEKSRVVHARIAVIVGGMILIGLNTRAVRREFGAKGKMECSWRVGHSGRDMMYYEEPHDGGWRRIVIDGEMLTGIAHHVIYFASPENWLGYPEWARQRRNEIIARVKSRFQEPDYLYEENGTFPRTVPTATDPVTLSPVNTQGRFFPSLLFLLAMTVAGSWMLLEGMKTGETRLGARMSGNHRVHREDKPVLFWTSMGLLGVCTVLSGVGGVWLAYTGLRGRAPSS